MLLRERIYHKTSGDDLLSGELYQYRLPFRLINFQDGRLSSSYFLSKGIFLKGYFKSVLVLEVDESYFGGKRRGKRGRGSKNKIPVFGILERGGKVKVEIVKNVKADTLLKEAIKKVKRGRLIYTRDVSVLFERIGVSI